MATQAQVAQQLHLQLSIDSPQRLQQAGAAWMQPPMGFYYGFAPQSELQVDIAIMATMARVLQGDGTFIPKPSPIWSSLRAMINTATPVSSAIVIMTTASAHASPLP
jgi:hypothetical protein